MQLSKSTYVVLAVVITVMTLSVTVFNRPTGSATPQDVRRTNEPLSERSERYPVVEAEEAEPSDPVKRLS